MSKLLSALLVSVLAVSAYAADAPKADVKAAPTSATATAKMHERHVMACDPADHEAYAKKRLDKEAAMLEITATQQPIWAEYAAAKLDLMTSFKPMTEHGKKGEETDAATLARKHAEQATTLAQKLTKVADATEKLQATLSDSQRKVFDRIAHQHDDFNHDAHHMEHEGMMGHEHMGMMHGKPTDGPTKAPAKSAQ